MEPDIDSDLKKARAFLVAFSTAVLLAWYFSADLTKINIIGFSLTIRDNAENLWMVIAVINIYFLLRYIQKLPPNSRRPDDAMRVVFEQTLISISTRIYRRKLRQEVLVELEREHGSLRLADMLPSGSIKREEQTDELEEYWASVLPVWKKVKAYTLEYSVPYRFFMEDGGYCTCSGLQTEIHPSSSVLTLSRVIGFVRGVILTPWVTEYILPAILGVLATYISIFAWCLVRPG